MSVVSNDMELLHAMASGDKNALVRLYQCYWQRLFLAAHNILKDKAACEDIVQDAFLQLWQRPKHCRCTVPLKPIFFPSSATMYSII